AADPAEFLFDFQQHLQQLDRLQAGLQLRSRVEIVPLTGRAADRRGLVTGRDPFDRNPGPFAQELERPVELLTPVAEGAPESDIHRNGHKTHPPNTKQRIKLTGGAYSIAAVPVILLRASGGDRPPFGKN